MPSLANYNVSKWKPSKCLQISAYLNQNLLYKDLLQINKAASIKATKKKEIVN